MPNILFQMLLRASNAVGYANYPDNVVADVRARKSAAGGHRRLPHLRRAQLGCRTCGWRWRRCIKTGAICEAAICYTGDILDPKRTKYGLKYYVELAKELEKMGAHILAIKDMAGLCKPYAAELLVKTLKQEIGIPIHFHTHDTARRAGGVDPQSGRSRSSTSPMRRSRRCRAARRSRTSTRSSKRCAFTPRDTEPRRRAARRASPNTGEAVREFYAPFESADAAGGGRPLSATRCRAGSTRTCIEQAQALGLADRWREVCRDVRRRQSAARRHREGDADVEGGRRHGAVPGREQPDARRTLLDGDARTGVPASR